MDYFAAITKEQILGIEKFYNDFMSDDNALTQWQYAKVALHEQLV